MTKNTGWSKHAIVTALKEANEAVDERLTMERFDECPGPCSAAVVDHFGSWYRACFSADVPVGNFHNKNIPIPVDVETRVETVYRDGYRARAEGMELSDCPYDSNRGGYRKAWKRGWDAAHNRIKSMSAKF